MASVRNPQSATRNPQYSIRDLWPLLLPLLLLLPGITGFSFPSAEARFSDMAVSHYPNAVFLKRAISEWGTIPLWSPSILSGFPFAADPLSGLWYPPGWLALLLPLPLGFNVMVALHLLWGGLGTYRLLREEGLGHPAAMLGGLAFETLPKLLAHFGAGHLTLLYAVPWTPWLLLAARRAGRRKLLGQPGVILALIFMADVRWAAYAGLIWVGWTLAHSQIKRWIRMLSQLGLAAVLSAPLALPLLEYTRLSTRAQLTVQDAFTQSLPPARLLGLGFPSFDANHEWVLYPGALVLILSLLALLWKPVRVRVGFWLWVAGLTLLYSLGDNLPLLPELARLPGFDLLRVPPRALFLTGLALAALAAYSVDHLLSGPSPGEQRRASLVLVGLASFAAILTGGIWALTGTLPANFVWGTGVLLVGALWVIVFMSRRVQARMWMVVLMGICLFDWGGVGLRSFSYHSVEETLGEQSALAEYLAEQPGMFRVYSPSYSLPQQTAAHYGLELADGVNPMQLAAYRDHMTQASGVPSSTYSVTLPPFATGEPATDNADYMPDAELLGLFNVRYVAAEFDLEVEGLRLVREFGNTRLYENELAQPRAWVDSPSGEDKPVEIVEWKPNRITLRAEGPGRLTLSENTYPGWRAWVDGEAVKVDVMRMLLRGVWLGDGQHEVVFGFRPLSVYGGGVLAVLVILVVSVVRLVRPLRPVRLEGNDEG